MKSQTAMTRVKEIPKVKFSPVKHVRVTFDDGSQWNLPVPVLASMLGHVYEAGTTYLTAVTHFASNDGDLTKALPALSWDQVSFYAKRVREPKIFDVNSNHAKEWPTAVKQVVTV